MEAQMLALPLVYAAADSFAGGSLGQWAKRLDERLPGRAALWGALLCAGVGFLAKGPWGAAMALPWFLYRIAGGWTLLGGSATPVGAKQIAGTLARHLFSMLGLVVVFWANKPILTGALALGGYAIGATILAALYGQRKKDAIAAGEAIEADDPFNRNLELCRGGLFGLVVAFTLT